MIVYLAHPVGHGEDRERNLANVQEWFLWLFEMRPEWAINVPWFIYVSNLTEEHRDRAIRDDLAILETCQAIVLCGGKITPGMQMELDAAKKRGLKVYDLTGAGYSIPQDGKTQAEAEELLWKVQ